jgi:catechol 2,3-dioxygenase-like lactoylglutathione lyase family enzyme
MASSTQEQASAKTQAPVRFSHINLPTRDFAQATRFYTEVLGGELIEDGPPVRIQLGTFGIALGPQQGGATEPNREHPHYAFTVHAEDFKALKERLEAYGVPTHEPWTRSGSPCSLMYFRDPSGNQFEM